MYSSDVCVCVWNVKGRNAVMDHFIQSRTDSHELMEIADKHGEQSRIYRELQHKRFTFM